MINIAAAQVNAGGLWEAIRSFFTDFNRMFPGFEASLEDARAPFFIFGFVILVYSLVKKLSGPSMSPSSNMCAITSVVILVGAMAFCIKITNLTQVAFLDLAQLMAPDADPVKIETSMEELLVALTKGEAEKQQQAAAGGQAATNMWDQVQGVVAGAAAIASNPGAAVNAGLDSVLASIQTLVQYALIYILIALCKLAEMVMWIVILVQKFLILINSIFLPVMIAMLSVGALSSISTRYILSMFGVCAWPVAWGVVNAGTVAMMISVNKTLEGATDLNSLMSILWAYAICLVIPFWLVFGYIFGPLVLQKMVTTGVGVAQGLMGGAAGIIGTAATIAGSGAMLAAAGGASASAAGGSKPSTGGEGGGSPNGGGTPSPTGSSGGGGELVGASLAGTFADMAGTSMKAGGSAVGKAGNAIAESEGHSGVYSSSAGETNSNASGGNSTSEGGSSGMPAAGDANSAGGSSAQASSSPSSASKSAQKPTMTMAQLDAYAAQRGREMATPQKSTNPTDLYPGLSESSAEAWQLEMNLPQPQEA